MSLYYKEETVSLYCGDVEEVMSSEEWRYDGEVACIVADPPFNAGKDYGPETNDARSRDEYDVWLTAKLTAAIRCLKPGGAAWVMNETDNLGLTLRILDDLGLELANIVPWLYGNPTPSKSRMPKSWRPIVFARKPGGEVTWNGKNDWLRRDTLYCNRAHIESNTTIADVWPDIPKLVGGFLAQRQVLTRPDGRFAHLAQMPRGLAERPILLSTDPGDLVLDPFCGSGTTLEAAKSLGRRSIGIEISQQHCDTVVGRFAQGVMALP